MPGSNYGVISSSPLTFQANGRYLTLVSGFTHCAGAILSDPSKQFQNGMELNLKWHGFTKCFFYFILRLFRALKYKCINMKIQIRKRISPNCGEQCLQHGLRTPMKAFFHQNSQLLGLGRQFLGHLGYFRLIYLWFCESLVHVFH